jgi:hypothetical protein
MIEQSLLIRGIANLIGASRASIAESWTASVVRRLRVTQIAIVITCACVTHVALLQVMPERLAPVKPLAYGMVLAFAALVVAVGRITIRSNATASAESNAGTANAMNS